MTIQHIYTEKKEKLADLAALPLKNFEDGMQVFQYQSPIDFGDVKEVVSEPELDLTLHYETEEYKQDVFGGSYHLVPLENKSYLTFEGQRFDLVDIHVHFPSEHTFKDQASKFEFHIVHESAEGENLVIGILYEGVEDEYLEEGPERRDVMKELFLERENMTFNPKTYLPQPLSYYHFVGSLTTPPYSGPVLWFMMDEMQYANMSIIKRVKEHVPINNNRVTFGLQDRIIYHN